MNLALILLIIVIVSSWCIPLLVKIGAIVALLLLREARSASPKDPW